MVDNTFESTCKPYTHARDVSSPNTIYQTSGHSHYANTREFRTTLLSAEQSHARKRINSWKLKFTSTALFQVVCYIDGTTETAKMAKQSLGMWWRRMELDEWTIFNGVQKDRYVKEDTRETFFSMCHHELKSCERWTMRVWIYQGVIGWYTSTSDIHIPCSTYWYLILKLNFLSSSALFDILLTSTRFIQSRWRQNMQFNCLVLTCSS